MLIAPEPDNLTIEAKFFSSVKDIEQLRNSILEAILATENTIAWKISINTKKYLELIYDFSILFKDRKEVKKAKFHSDKYGAGLLLSKTSAVSTVTISLNEEKNGTMIHVLCLPVMYTQINQIVGYQEKKFSTFEVKSAIMECQGFVLSIFHGSLGYETIEYPHPKKLVEPKSYEFLKNTKEERELTKRITSALPDAKKEVYICGWIGQAIVPFLRNLKNRGMTIRIITKTPSEETAGRGYKDKTRALEQLTEFLNKEDISLVSTCHSRFLIIDDDNIFVGSMDMDSESFDQREECAIWSNDPSLVIRAKVCFEHLFKGGKSPSK